MIQLQPGIICAPIAACVSYSGVAAAGSYLCCADACVALIQAAEQCMGLTEDPDSALGATVTDAEPE